MKRTVRILVIAAMVAGQQLLAPVLGHAQVDPCNPIPIPDLCDVVPEVPGSLDPSPDPSPSPKPSPSPTPKKEKPKNDGGGGGQQQGTGGEQPEEEPGKKQRKKVAEEEQPFVLGGPKNSARLLKILTKLAEYGVPVEQSLSSVVGPFPVAGLAWWTDDWGACRDGCARSHEGLDIFAKTGTPLVATADGVVTQVGTGTLSGLHVEIEDANGIQYFYAHLSDWADGLHIGQQVRMGQVVGYVGNTGNAIYTPPHVHFEFQPGGVPQPPKPWVDKWLKIAEQRALALLAEHAGDDPITLEELDIFRLTRLLDLAGEGDPSGTSPSSRLLLLAGLQPAVSGLEVARQALDDMAWEIDWSEQVDQDLAELYEEYQDLSMQSDVLGSSFLPSPPVETDAVLPEESHFIEVGD